MFLNKFARPNQKISFGRMIASVDLSQCVHANGFIVLNKARRHNAGQNSLNAFSLFRLQCELSLRARWRYAVSLQKCDCNK